MKKILLIFSAVAVACPGMARGAVTIKKAAPVAAKTTSAVESTGSLVPTVLGLVSAVKSLDAKTKELTAECIPSAAEITFVNNTVKEWAKTGASTADEAEKALGMKRCKVASGGYAQQVEINAGEADDFICTDWFDGAGNTGMIWEKYPMAAKATYCADGSFECGNSQKKTVSNIYNVFNLIDFGVEDYTASEAKMASQLLAKIEKCSDAKLSAAKRAMWGEFLVNTISGVGQSTNTGAIMQSVGSISQSGLGGGISSLSGLATQLLDK
ncbi:MAG: hypothetical protein K2I81_04215 [Alphaproteobacteria bacterium]|nr:hypothetical protein [Alphaproteobacteria bacterium]